MNEQQAYVSLEQMHLRALSQKELRERLAVGPIPIDEWFSRLTKLYYENHSINDDFPTPPELFPEMGSSIALFAIKIYEGMGSPKQFDVYEAGGGNGTLMLSFLQEASKHGEFFNALVYHEIEQSSNLIERQKNLINTVPSLTEKVIWHQSDVCEFEFPHTEAGMYLVSENDDDLPSKAVYKRNGVPTELYIVLEHGEIVQKEMAASEELVQFLQTQTEWWEKVPENLRIPLPVHMESVYIRERLIRAFESLAIWTSDYGYELFSVAKHMPNWVFPQCKTFIDNSHKFFKQDEEYATMYGYAGIGNHTSNIDFSLVAQPGMQYGYETQLVSNRDFLVHHGLQQYAEDHVRMLMDEGRLPEANLYLRRLAHIIDRDGDWKTQVQWKGVSMPITVAQPSENTIPWLYKLADFYALGDIEPAYRKGLAR